MKYHTISTISVKNCEEMVESGNFSMIIKKGKLGLFSKSAVKRKYDEFMDQLVELFNSEQISSMISIDFVIQKMGIKLGNMIMLHDALKICYGVKDTPEKIKTLDKLKQKHREMFFCYPQTVDMSAGLEDQKKQINAVLAPIRSEIEQLELKMGSIKPKDLEKPKKTEKTPLFSQYIAFIESVENNGYIDRDITVRELKFKYDQAVKKNNQRKQRNG